MKSSGLKVRTKTAGTIFVPAAVKGSGIVFDQDLWRRGVAATRLAEGLMKQIVLRPDIAGSRLRTIGIAAKAAKFASFLVVSASFLMISVLEIVMSEPFLIISAFEIVMSGSFLIISVSEIVMSEPFLIISASEIVMSEPFLIRSDAKLGGFWTSRTIIGWFLGSYCDCPPSQGSNTERKQKP